MKSLPAFLALAFGLAALGLGVLAWRQAAELQRLQTAEFSAPDRADLRQRLWAAEKRARLAEDRARAAKPANDGAQADPENPAETAGPAAGKPAAKKGPSQLEILAFINSPETQRALGEKLREQVDARYAALFKALNLSPPQLGRLKNLLLERQTAPVDVAAAALAQGLKPNQEELRKLVAAAQDETDRKLQTELGAAAYAQFQTYENAQLFRGATNDLQRGLARADAALTDAQAEQFTTDIATVAQNRLTPAQQQALRTLTQLQQTRQTLQQVEQLYKEKNAPPKPAKKPGG